VVASIAMLAFPATGHATTLGTVAGGSIGLRLVDVPSAEQANPRASIYIVDHLAPGTTIRRRIEVSNTTASTAHVVLYAAAATIAAGSFLGAEGHTPDELSTWTSISPAAPDVPSGGRTMADVTIRVPNNASPGERYAVVWAEVRSAPPGEGEVVQVNRVGIRLYLSVGPGGAPAADFAIESLTAMRGPDGAPMVVATVHNTGGRALDMSGTLRLVSGPGGLSAGPFPATLGVTLAIGDTEPVTIALDPRLPAGPWDARIVLHSGLLVRSARATITFPVAGVGPAVSTASTRPWWLYLAIVVVILMVLGILIFAFKRRRDRLAARQHHLSAREAAPSTSRPKDVRAGAK
jgi:hypothetical protein